MAFEGAEGFKARAEAFRRTQAIKAKVPFFLIGTNAKLVRDHKALIESINGQMDAPPVIVVLDTLHRSIDGSESKDADMGAYLAAAETIHLEFDCAVLIVHHCGVDGTRPRGHTSLTGAVDVQIAVKRDASNTIIAEVEAMKDGAEGARFASALKVIEVGIDDDGEPITCCVIVEVEGGSATPNKPKAKVGKGKPGWRSICSSAPWQTFTRGRPLVTTYRRGRTFSFVRSMSGAAIFTKQFRARRTRSKRLLSGR